METSTRRRTDWVTLIAVYHFLEAGIMGLGLMLVGLSGLLVLFTMPVVRSPFEVLLPLALLGLAGLYAGAILVLDVAVGVGLLRLANWARWGAIILSVLRLGSFPIGTVVGALSIYYLVQDGVRDLFRARR